MNYCGNLAVKLESRNAKYLDQNLWYRMWERWLIDAHQSPLVHELKEREILISTHNSEAKQHHQSCTTTKTTPPPPKYAESHKIFLDFYYHFYFLLILFCFVWSAGNRKPFLFCFTDLFFFFFFFFSLSFFFFLFFFS